MAKYLKLMDYKNREMHFPTIDLENFTDGGKFEISRIEISVVSGDEIALIEYSDGTFLTLESCYLRTEDFFDNEYTLYDREKNINRVEEFENRTTSYDIW